MIPIKINNLEKTDRIFLGWSSWNNYLDDVKKQLNHAGFKHVDIHKIKNHWSTILLLPFILMKMFICLFYYDAFFLFDGKSFFLPIPLKFFSKLSFLCFKDLWLLKFLNKKVYFVFQGSDIRRYKKHRYKLIPSKYIKYFNTAQIISKSLKQVDGIIVSTIDLLQDLPKCYLGKSIWIPKLANYDTYMHNCFRSLENGFKSDKIIHATTNRTLKGTDLLEETFKKIDKFKFVFFEHKTKFYIFQKAQNCFCCIDQLVLGVYGTFCMEMMELGIPVLGYISQTVRDIFREKYDADIPILQIEPDDLLATIQKQINFLLNFENYKMQIVRQKNFLEKFHKI